jgi:hypothetical protein
MTRVSGKFVRAVLAACGVAALAPAALAQPANDLCSSPAVLTVGTTAGSNIGATSDLPFTSCAFSPTDNLDVWYTFTPGASGSFRFDTETTVGLDTTLAIFDACNGTELACDDDDGTGTLSLVLADLVSGTPYRVRVAGWNGQSGNFNLNVADLTAPGACCLSGGCTVTSVASCAAPSVFQGGNTVCSPNPCPQPVGNDGCGVNTAPYQVPSTGGIINATATQWSRDGAGCVGDTGADIYYYFTPGIAGPWRVTLCGAAPVFDSVLSVHTNECPVSPANSIACDDDGCGGIGWSTLPNVDLSVGTPYIIRVARYAGNADMTFQLRVENLNVNGACCCGPCTVTTAGDCPVGFQGANTTCSPSPCGAFEPNDRCEDAAVLAPGSSVQGSNQNACGTNITSCAGADTWDVWYTFTAPTAAEFQFDTLGSTFDTSLALFDACGGTEVSCNDDSNATLQSELFINLSQGQVIKVRVAGYNGQRGSFTLTASGGTPPPPPPANDDCANAQVITGNQANASIVAGGATPDLDVACNGPASFETRFGVWFSYTPAETGSLVIEETSANNVVTAVFTGGCGALSEIACEPLEETDPIAVTAGVNYLILIGLEPDSGNARGTYELTFTNTPAPGACCVGTTCLIVEGASACSGQGGTWQGAGSSCGGDPFTINDADVSIPDYDGVAVQVATSTFTVTDNVTVTDVNVFVGLSHTFGSDLSVRLRGPNNVVADLIIRPTLPGCAVGDFGDYAEYEGLYAFDDQTPQTLATAYEAALFGFVPPGRYQASGCDNVPVSLNSIFAGINAAGVWTVEVSDGAALDTGTITSIGVVVNNLGTPGPCTGGGGNGACCSGVTCSVTSSAACVGAGTRFAGGGTVCNAPGNNTTPCCKADTNQDNLITVQDLFDYLTIWFPRTPSAEFDGLPGVTIQDLFDFLGAWFARCG